METICVTLSVGWLAVGLGVLWFFLYGVGTTWQMVCEGQKATPPRTYTMWTIITQGFANGVGAAVGWLAAYMLWVLWRESRDRFDLGHVALFVIALLGVTGWLPRRAQDVFSSR